MTKEEYFQLNSFLRNFFAESGKICFTASAMGILVDYFGQQIAKQFDSPNTLVNCWESNRESFLEILIEEAKEKGHVITIGSDEIPIIGDDVINNGIARCPKMPEFGSDKTPVMLRGRVEPLSEA